MLNDTNLGLAEKLQNALNANFGKRKFIIDKKIERGRSISTSRHVGMSGMSGLKTDKKFTL